MADTLKVLGQVNPSAVTLTDAYTVPGATTAAVSSLVVCNQATTSTTFRLSIAKAGAADAVKQYLYYDTAVPANDTFIATIGASLAATDVVRVYAATSIMSFQVFGVEIT